MINVRRATREDILPLTDLFDLYRIYYQQPSDIASAKAFLLQRMDKEESVIFVAAAGDRLIGFTQLYPLFSSVGLKRTWLLNDLYVHAGFRGEGVGTKLLEAARAHGLQTGARYLMLQTQMDNFTAQSVYEKNGWQKLSDYFYEMPLD